MAEHGDGLRDPTGAPTTTRAAPRSRADATAARSLEPGRQAVVDDHHRRAAQVRGRGVAAEGADPRLHLRAARRDEPLELGGRHADARRGPAVQQGDAALGDRADRELRLDRGAELAHHRDVERRPQGAGDLRRHRHPAAGHAEHHGALPRQVAEHAPPGGGPHPPDRGTPCPILAPGRRAGNPKRGTVPTPGSRRRRRRTVGVYRHDDGGPPMKVRDVMTAHPVLATARDADRDRVRQLMEDADIHHVPVVDGDELVGVWAQGEDGSVFLLGGDRVIELPAEAEADQAMSALMRDAEVVLVRDEGLPSGILTRADALAILRTALGRGVGKRHPQPTVIRVAGARGTGKTTLIMRTLAQLSGLDAVVLQVNEPTGPASAGEAREVVDGSAHWRAGLGRAVARLQDAQLILVEDRDEDPDLSRGIGEDVQVAVINALDMGRVPTAHLRDAQAIVLTHAEEATDDEAEAAAAACRGAVPRRPRVRRGAGRRRRRPGRVGPLGPRLRDAPARLAPLLRAASAAALLAGRRSSPRAARRRPPGTPVCRSRPTASGWGRPPPRWARAGTRSGRGRSAPTMGGPCAVEARRATGAGTVAARAPLRPVPAGAGGLAAAMAPGWVGGRRVAGRGRRVHVAVRVGRRGAWRVAAVPSGPAAAGPAAFASPRVAAGADGSAAVVWAAREAPGWVVRGAARSGARGVWRATPALMLDPGAGMPSLGLAPDGGAAVAWGPQPGPGAVRAALRPAGDGWGPAVVLDGTGRRPVRGGRRRRTVRVAWSTGGGDPVVRVASADLRAGSFGAAEDVAPGSGAQVGAPAGGGLAVAWTPPAGGLAALVRGPAAPGAPAGLAAPGAPADGRPPVVAAGGAGRAAVTWIERERSARRSIDQSSMSSG